MNLSNDDLLSLYFLQKYNFLTIDQVVKALDERRNYQAMSRRLRKMKTEELIDYFGGHRVGFTNVPKVYFLKKKGYELLLENSISPESLGRYKKKNKPGWTAKTKHRLYLIDVFLSLERAIWSEPKLELRRVFLEYNQVKKDSRVSFETTDFVSDKETAENKIVPDGAFILESFRTGAKVLFFVEMDMETEMIVSYITKDTAASVYEKIKKYDRYLLNKRYALKYQEWGQFDHFVVLFITLSVTRLKHIREKLSPLLPSELHEYYLFNTYDQVCDDFLNQNWLTRSVSDEKGYSILD